MALQAVHIRARSRSPVDNSFQDIVSERTQGPPAEPLAVHERRSSSPQPRIARRPGLGSSSNHINHVDNGDGWHSLRTGDLLAAKSFPIRNQFVRATHLSDPSLSANTHSHPLESTSDSDPHITTPIKGLERPTPTLAQLYSQLAQDASASDQAQPAASGHASSISLSSSPNYANKQAHVRHTEDEHHHSHRHRHHHDARQRSEWFITKALTKMRRSQPSTSSDPGISAKPTAKADGEVRLTKESTTSKAQRCPRCGDTLPPNATPQDVARHRQSIGHRLGLNAPVSSASASEAPSPTPSEAPTPPTRSGASTPVDVSLLDASMQALHRRSAILPRRLSNAPRWKKIARDNVGHSLLSRMGWKEGMGLGVQEWKWQQQRREKTKKQRTNAVRALLLQKASASQDASVAYPPSGSQTAPSLVADPVQPAELALQQGVDAVFEAGPPESDLQPEWMQLLLQQNTAAASSAAEPLSLQEAFPFQIDVQNSQQRREAARHWLSNLAGSDLEWFRCLTMDEQQSLEEALLSGQVTLPDIQAALLSSVDAQASSQVSSQAGSMEGATLSGALLHPVPVELRADRSGIGSKRSLSVGDVGERPLRRSRDAEGSVDIRRPSSSIDSEHKKVRTNADSRAFKPLRRSRSHSGSRRKNAGSNRRGRELAYQKDKRDWLDLRASLS